MLASGREQFGKLGIARVERDKYENTMKGARGPFGLTVGASLSELVGDHSEIAPYAYQFTQVPKPHSAFESYILRVSPTHGLYMVKAIGLTIRCAGHGQELMTAFTSLRERLNKTYGRGKTTDALIAGSVWNEPLDWMRALALGERGLHTFWEHEHGSHLPTGTDCIVLAANATEEDAGYLIVEYTFANAGAARGEIAALEDDAL